MKKGQALNIPDNFDYNDKTVYKNNMIIYLKHSAYPNLYFVA